MKGPLDMHSRFRELIATRLDGPLTRPELRALTGHLRTCATCREVEREYREQRNMLRSLPSPIPPRDLWARTSGALDREVARGSHRRPGYGRAFLKRRRRSASSAALLSMIAAVGLIGAITVTQLAPMPRNQPTSAPATPFAVRPQPLAFVGAGSSDITVYRTQVRNVCPTGVADCAVDEPIERTAVLLPGKLRPRNVALSPSGARLALVGQQVGEDVIAVVTLPQLASSGHAPRGTAGAGNLDPSPAGSSPHPSDSSGPADPSASGAPEGTPAASTDAGPTETPDPEATSTPSLDPTTPSEPPASALAGMTLVAILDNVHSVGAPPAWSVDGETLAFSAMPADGRHGPDVYVWSVGDDKARPLTDDHSSYFASWSGRRIVVSRFLASDGESQTTRIRTVVIDPISQEERRVDIGPVWLPHINPARTHALVWSGQLELSQSQPVPRTGALYLLDWAAVDPFAEGATPPLPTNEPETPAPSPENTPEPTPEASPEATPEPTPEATPEPTAEPTPEPSSEPTEDPTDEPSASPPNEPSGSAGQPSSGGAVTSQRSDLRTTQSSSEPSPPPVDATPSSDPTPETTPAQVPVTPREVATPAAVPATPHAAQLPQRLVAVEPARDPGSDPVRDWQAQWSSDGQVVGIWIADAAGSTWGRLVVHALDVRSVGLHSDPLVSATLARRGFSLGLNRVAWVAPSDADPEGELRVRTWGSDGVGGWRVQQLDGEEVVPAF